MVEMKKILALTGTLGKVVSYEAVVWVVTLTLLQAALRLTINKH